MSSASDSDRPGDAQEITIASELLTAGRLRLDRHASCGWAGAARVPLSALEFAILECLIENRHVPLSRQALTNRLSGGEQLDAKLVDVGISRLCRKFRHAGVEQLVENVWGAGYILVQEQPPAVDILPTSGLKMAA